MTAIHRFIIATVILLVGAGSFLPVPIQAGTAESSSPATQAEKAQSDDPKRDVDTMPVPVATVQPTYPEGARKTGAQGTVLVGVKIDRSGTVESASVTEGVEGHPELGEAALEAVRQWRFEPAKEGGKPVDIEVTIPVKFRLSDDKGARKEEKN
jgi:protein TonB